MSATTTAGHETLTVVLVHGLWHGGWAWDEVRPRLAEAGVSSVAVDLPMSDLAADVAATLAAIERLEGRVLLVGHSYGGAVITEAGAHPRVAHLLYLAGFPLAEGESVRRTLPELGIPGTRLSEAFVFSEDGTQVRLEPTLARTLLYADAPEAVAHEAVSRLRSVGVPVFGGVPASIAWRSRPTTYVVSSDDLTVHPDLQRAMAARAGGRSFEWPGGHSQAAVHPDQVAALVVALARGLSEGVEG